MISSLSAISPLNTSTKVSSRLSSLRVGVSQYLRFWNLALQCQCHAVYLVLECHTDGEELFINTGNTSATGMVTSEGFVVLKGAVVNEKTSAKSLSAGMKKLRDRIFADGKVENMTTTEDILFSSSSAAAEFVLGYSASGPRTWKAKDGRTLKEIEDNATVD